MAPPSPLPSPLPLPAACGDDMEQAGANNQDPGSAGPSSCPAVSVFASAGTGTGSGSPAAAVDPASHHCRLQDHQDQAQAQTRTRLLNGSSAFRQQPCCDAAQPAPRSAPVAPAPTIQSELQRPEVSETPTLQRTETPTLPDSEAPVLVPHESEARERQSQATRTARTTGAATTTTPTPHSQATTARSPSVPPSSIPAYSTTTSCTASACGTTTAKARATKLLPKPAHDHLDPSLSPDSPPPLVSTAASSVPATGLSSQKVTPPPMAVDPSPSSSSKMLFSDIYKSPRSPLSKIRHSVFPSPLAIPLPEYDADLLSRDKTKQKEAVKRHLAEKVRNDWEFTWPPQTTSTNSGATAVVNSTEKLGESEEGAAAQAPAVEAVDDVSPSDVPLVDQAETAATRPVATENGETIEPTEPEPTEPEPTDDEPPDSDDESVYSIVSEDTARYKPRQEWASELSDDDAPRMSLSPFRFDSPEAIGAAVKRSVAEKQARRRRELREEMEWNEGLACFEARRNAWTGAHTVRVRPKPTSPTTSFASLSPKRLFRRSSIPPTSPTTGATQHPPLQQRPSNETSDGSFASRGADLTAQRSKESSHSGVATSPPPVAPEFLPVETLLPLAPPLLPINNPMRASITPAVYLSLYEKVILHTLTPSCPINLSDMVRSCVAGWKRDGEWPPKPSAAQEQASIVAVRRKKRMSIGGNSFSQGGSRRLSFGFLGRGDKTVPETEEAGGHGGGAGKGLRRSLQRVLGFGHAPTGMPTPPPTAQANGNLGHPGEEAPKSGQAA